MPRHRDSKTKKPRHQDSKTKKPQRRDSKTKKPRNQDYVTKTPRHRETETIKPRHRDSKTFFQRTRSHDIEIPRLKNHDIEIPRLKNYNITFLWNSDPYAPLMPIFRSAPLRILALSRAQLHIKSYFNWNKTVPTGVRFYTKLGSGQCRYSQWGTSDSQALLWIALYSRMSYSECRTSNNCISQSEENIFLYGVGHSEQGTDNHICLDFYVFQLE